MLEAIEPTAATHAGGIVTMLLDLLAHPPFANVDSGHVRTIMCGGSDVLRERLAPDDPRSNSFMGAGS